MTIKKALDVLMGIGLDPMLVKPHVYLSWYDDEGSELGEKLNFDDCAELALAFLLISQHLKEEA